MNTWLDVFGRAAVVLAGTVFVLALVLAVMWQVRAIWRIGRQLEEERRVARQARQLPFTDSYVPPGWN